MSEFYVYENWRAQGHKATIHRSECAFCNRGSGLHPGSSNRNGTWHGPMTSFDEALDVAQGTGANAKTCRSCNPTTELDSDSPQDRVGSIVGASGSQEDLGLPSNRASISSSAHARPPEEPNLIR
jgi:hypothetical protein